jgi:hypothetical protein
MQYSDFQAMPSSEKITLCMMNASSRLMGWTLDTGSIYTISGLDVIVDGIEDSGTAYTEAADVGSVTASKYFYDVATQTLYLRTTGSDNPNGRFIVLRQKLCFANVPITLPHDLASGAEVPFAPILKSTSQFGVTIDVIAQSSEAIEGSGTLTFINDQDFWPANYDKVFFENQSVKVYSYNRGLDPSDAKLIFKGTVEKRNYTASQVSFTLKDQFAEIRSNIPLALISDLGERTGSDIANTRQRMIIGSVQGHLPVNLDQVLDGYPITGTLSGSNGSPNVAGTGTVFLTELSPDDELVLDGVRYTVATVPSDTSLTLTENISNPTGLSAVTGFLLPDRPKRFINREWLVAGHTIREPLTAVQNGSAVDRLILDDASDIKEGDMLYVGTIGSGELVRVDSLLGASQVSLATSLATIPPIGTPVTRPGVQNVRINDVDLVYYTDYTFDASMARLTLRDSAEANSAPIKQMTQNLTFNTTRTVTGTNLKKTIEPGYMVGVVGNADFYEVLSVDSDTSMTLRTAATSINTTALGRYKSLIFDPSNDTLSLDTLGRTTDGTSGGTLVRTSPQAVSALLSDAGLGAYIDTDSFTAAETIAYQSVGLVIPETTSSTDAPTYRDTINALNKSTFCSLVQNDAFDFSLEVLRPTKPVASQRLSESDILSMDFDTTAENMVKTSIVNYGAKEYDYLTGKNSIQTHQKTSDVSNYILKTSREKTFVTKLVNSSDALIHANRWAYLLQNTAGRITLQTKLQGMAIAVGDVIEIEHRKLFERFGGSDNRRLMFVESVRKSGSAVEIQATDLSNSFNRICSINDITNDFSTATLDEKLYGGFYTDEYGLISNASDTFGTNLIW